MTGSVLIYRIKIPDVLAAITRAGLIPEGAQIQGVSFTTRQQIDSLIVPRELIVYVRGGPDSDPLK